MRERCPACLTGRTAIHDADCPDAGRIRVMRFVPAGDQIEPAWMPASALDAEDLKRDAELYGSAFATIGGRRVDPARVEIDHDGTPYVLLRNPLPQQAPFDYWATVREKFDEGMLLTASILFVVATISGDVLLILVTLAALVMAFVRVVWKHR